MHSASRLVSWKVASAWAGVSTIGSRSLNEVFRTAGTPVIRRSSFSRALRRGDADWLTVWTRAVPSTWTTAAILPAMAGRTGGASSM